MSRQPDPYRSLREELSRIKVTLRRMASASPFFGTGMHPNGSGGIDSDNFEAGVSGYSFKSDGNAEFNDLTLRGGIIGNDALTEPVVPGVVNLFADNFSLSTAFAERVGINLTVPDGCTRLLASMSAWLTAYNPNTTGGSDGSGSDYLYVYCRIASTSGQYNPAGVSGNGGTASASAGYGQLLTGLAPGGTVRIGAFCSSQYTTIPAGSTNYVTVTGTLNWLR